MEAEIAETEHLESYAAEVGTAYVHRVAPNSSRAPEHATDRTAGKERQQARCVSVAMSASHDGRGRQFSGSSRSATDPDERNEPRRHDGERRVTLNRPRDDGETGTLARRTPGATRASLNTGSAPERPP